MKGLKLDPFEEHLRHAEKSENTIKKYTRDVRKWAEWCGANGYHHLSKEAVLKYRDYLKENRPAASVNTVLSSINSFLRFLSLNQYCVKLVRTQRKIFRDKEKELSKEEYKRLIMAAKSHKNERLDLVIQTICATGIRVGELRFITVESVEKGQACVLLKGKERIIILPHNLQKTLQRYIAKRKMKSGSVFITKSGQALNRSNIWTEMKKLCKDANVNPAKVFPHNLRHLFARCFYSVDKDIARLADVLGHSSIETTRIYIAECGDHHRRRLEQMHLTL